MNFPSYVTEIFAKKFTAEQVEQISKYWWFFADQGFRFSSSTEKKILKEGTLVLACIKESSPKELADMDESLKLTI
jgi:hypothetical protein